MGSAAEQRLAGGGERRRRRTNGFGWRGAYRGGSADHEEASLGVNLSRGGVEKGVLRRAAAALSATAAHRRLWVVEVGSSSTGGR